MSHTSGKMVLVDAHALIYQMFHAIGEMTSPDGRPTNAIFGVTRDLIYLNDDVKPTYLLCAFDLAGPTFRDAIYPEYKQNRPPPPEDLKLQVPVIQEILQGMNLPVLAVPGFEADDVMATLATVGSERGLEVSICTSDKDCRQLLNDRINVYNLRKRIVYDRAALLADWGITPEQVVDYQALVGDSVDNVPGVAGIGAKTASKLLNEYHSLDNLVANIENLKPSKIKSNLFEAIASGALERSRQLVTLNRNVPLTLDWDDWARRDWNYPKLLELFESLGFRSFSNMVRSRLKAWGQTRNVESLVVVGKSTPKQIPNITGDLFAEVEVPDGEALDFQFGANTVPDSWQGVYRLVDSQATWIEFLQKLNEQQRFAFDLETTGLDPFQSSIVGYAFCWKEGEAYYIPVRAPEGDRKLDPEAVLLELKPIFENPAVGKVNQNIKFDLLMLRGVGVEVRGVIGDSMIAHYLLNAGDRTHGLDELTLKYFSHENIPITDLIGKGRKQIEMDQVSTVKVRDYAAEDADAAFRLTLKFEEDLVKEGLRPLYEDLEVPLIDVLAEMEFNGIRLDLPFLARQSEEMTAQLEEIEAKIHEGVGRKFNISSPMQLREVLFDELKLPVRKRTDLTNEASTDQDSLEKLAKLSHPAAWLPRMMVEHRQVSKLKGTYVDALPKLVNSKTGRVHTSFNQTVAATGRLSSSDPNLQNIPARTEQGRQIRQAFIPKEGWTLLSADYSQVELRLMAHFSGDETLQQAFAENRDIHTLVASDIYKVPETEVSGQQRRVAKTVNFGVLYGMSAYGLSDRLGITRSEAERFIDAYFTRYPKVRDYQDELLKKAKQTGYVTTILGRRRKFDGGSIRTRTSYHSRNQTEREAINMEIQGSAADLMKKAMLTVHHRLVDEKRQARMLLSVHDELVFEVPQDELREVALLVRECMAGAMNLAVPLTVDVSAGPNWLNVEEILP